jgi:hypothetical protein
VFSGPAVWLIQCSLSLVCLVSLSVPSFVDLPLLYDTLVQSLFNSGWEYNFL